METMAAHGVQVVSVEDDHSYRLNETELEKILMNKSIKDLPVAVVSVAGAYRSGKSFLLSFFLRYLTASPSARLDGTWVGEGNEELTGFSWRGGTERNTTGILLWSEPFLVTLPSGEKVAVLLMDTQGTFDSSSTVQDCSTIFALSSLLSSTQIYNLKANITEEDLQYLQLFTDIGKMTSDHSGKIFQVLEFLIRDWMNPWEYEYGQAGGDLYLANKFKIDENQPKELRELRKDILASFEKVTCFLMAHPGLQIANPNFKGKPNEISQEFVKVLKELATSIFSPEKLCIKQLNGQIVKSHELFSFFKTYITIFNSNEIPKPSHILQTTAEAGLLLAANQIREEFEKNMELACGLEAPSMPISAINNIHQQEITHARATFKDKKLLGDQEDIDKKLEALMLELNDKLKEFVEINMSKTLNDIKKGNTAYEKAIEDVTKGKPLCVHDNDLPQIHDAASVAALNAFNENRKTGPDGQDADKDKFTKDLTEKFNALNLMNEQNNKSMVAELNAEYIEYIMSKVTSEPNLCEYSFAREHLQAKDKAIQEFESRRNLANSYKQDVYKSNMLETIELQYNQAKRINANANKKLFGVAITMFYERSTKLRDLQNYCMHPSDLERDHEYAKRAALDSISPKQLCGDNYTTLYETMRNHYETMKEINDSANEQAVTAGYWAYLNRYRALSNHWYWAFTSWSKAREYHEDALAVAKRKFSERRRWPKYYNSYDSYLADLVGKCEWYFRNS